LLRDKAKEKLYSFSLPETLERAQTAPLLKDFKLHATKAVKPPPEQIKGMLRLSLRAAHRVDLLLFLFSCVDDETTLVDNSQHCTCCGAVSAVYSFIRCYALRYPASC